MMKKNRILATVALLVLFLTSCGTSREKTRKPNENFSRGLLLVDNASSNAAFTVEPAGDLIQFIIPYQNEGQKIIFQYLQMNAAGVIEISKELDIQVNSFARNLQMISDKKVLNKNFFIGFHVFPQSGEKWGKVVRNDG